MRENAHRWSRLGSAPKHAHGGLIDAECVPVGTAGEQATGKRRAGLAGKVDVEFVALRGRQILAANGEATTQVSAVLVVAA